MNRPQTTISLLFSDDYAEELKETQETLRWAFEHIAELQVALGHTPRVSTRSDAERSNQCLGAAIGAGAQHWQCSGYWGAGRGQWRTRCGCSCHTTAAAGRARAGVQA